jgi:hypothetical protein
VIIIDTVLAGSMNACAHVIVLLKGCLLLIQGEKRHKFG